MQNKPVWGPALLLVGTSLSAGCIESYDEQVDTRTATCGAADAYTPYAGTSTSGDVAMLPWRGVESTYPDGKETFDGYTSTIECASEKSRRSYLDVTAGCLYSAITGDGAYHRARVEPTADAHAFRAVALGRDGDDVVKWTDQRSEYRFYYSGETTGTLPGFKVFARYRSEDDLYVASWRLDGVVQIQKKLCGEYTVLAKLERMLPPSPRAWHRIRFDAVGDDLALYLDDKLVLSTKSATFSWGTVGIRIDGITGAYLDDWHVFL